MNHHIRMILFVIILGGITSIVLVGANLITRERIVANQAIKLRSTILAANDVDYTLTTINDIFEDRIEVITIDDTYTFYHDTVSGNVSFRFEGGGVWGPIIGIITLASDFETIVDISILQQEETPGLGGIVAERWYLNQYIDVVMVPVLRVVKSPTEPNEADAITGATRTSNAFEGILNTDYEAHKAAWTSYQGGNEA
ncbi:MAG: FMN-binding protein [Acholeplasmataceae bacterium]